MSTTVVSQEHLFAFLRDPRSYPDHPPRVRMLLTHASWLVFTTRRAYKVKKPVNFGFLDTRKATALLRARGAAQPQALPPAFTSAS